MRKYFFIRLGFLSFIFLSACKTDEKIPVLEVTPENITFVNDAASKTVSVTASFNWDAGMDASGIDWCMAVPQNDNLIIFVTENPGKEIRETSITITSGELSKRIAVYQLGTQPAILVSPKEFSLLAKGGEIEFEVTANVEFSITNLPEWIKPSPATRTSNMKTSAQQYTVSENEETQRKAVLIIKDNDSDCQAELTVYQLGDKYVTEIETGIKDDIKVKILRAETSSYHKGGGEVEKSFDGNYSTIYHSDWANSGEHYFPITLDYYFDNADEIDYFIYYPRPDANKNGLFKETEIQVQHKGESSFTKITDKDFLGSNSPSHVAFNEPLKEVNAIRFIIKSGAGDGQGFASCAEMEFYKRNPDNFDPLSLFTDFSCSEIKQGVTMNEIENCVHPFFKNMALYMYKDAYPREFRIAEYRAYPHPSEDAAANKTSQYSLFDNPAGISVNEGDELIVLVSGTEDYPVSIKIQNLDNPTGNGFNQGASYPLSEGINKITAANKGLIYVMYHTTNFKTAPIIKIHFATGSVNGYFDGTKHTKEDWNRLIDAAVDKYFDVIGQYAHLTFPTERFRNHTGNRGKELIDLFDRLVYAEMELEGMVKYNRMFRNRMYFCVVYGSSYMFASGNHTGYHDGTLSDLCDVSKMKNEKNTPNTVWGPAHEVGHMNQTRPGFNWLGMTEVTNNICSMYVQSTFGYPTRLQTERVSNGDYSNRYEKGMNEYFTTGIPHNQPGEDVFCKLVPFWQLKLYIVNVLGKEDFYKDVYEFIRQTPKAVDDKRTNGERQLEFVKTACEAAQLNLEDFFGRWGFFTEIDAEINDYSAGLMQINKNQIDQTLSYIRSNYPTKPVHKFEYITDNNVDIYKSGSEIVKGTASRNGQTFAMIDWKNVVAYEIRDVDTELVFVSLQPTFTMKPAWKNEYKVYAVSPTGKEMEVTF
ncbi:hypothetical protein EZS27_005031 [termite gut metagenome]|uniref:Peptidase M60 domain-containing protein n=1 Tax=termite gut metagenome TaxID=433724 RepID=A0A5J4SMW2_9ZZZZ